MPFRHRIKSFYVILNQLPAKRKLKRKLDKKTVSYGQAGDLIIAITQKYDAFGDEKQADTFNIEIETNIAPEIVITETFI